MTIPRPALSLTPPQTLLLRGLQLMRRINMNAIGRRVTSFSRAARLGDDVRAYNQRLRRRGAHTGR